jgi:hypothetical protein
MNTVKIEIWKDSAYAGETYGVGIMQYDEKGNGGGRRIIGPKPINTQTVRSTKLTIDDLEDLIKECKYSIKHLKKNLKKVKK